MNRDRKQLRESAAQLSEQAVVMLADTCRGQSLDDMPAPLAYWYMRYLRHGLNECMAGSITDPDARAQIEDEAIRLALIPPRPGDGGSGLILPN